MFPDSISVNFTVTIDPYMERAPGLADYTDFIKVKELYEKLKHIKQIYDLIIYTFYKHHCVT